MSDEISQRCVEPVLNSSLMTHHSSHAYSPFLAMYLMRSRTRQEYPHSFSYQERILIMLPPITLVYSASTIEEFEFCLKSEETSGSSEKLRIPASSSFAASLRALLTSSVVVSFSTAMTTSTSETLGVGTRTLMPSNFPFNSGRTSAT